MELGDQCCRFGHFMGILDIEKFYKTIVKGSLEKSLAFQKYFKYILRYIIILIMKYDYFFK